MFRWDKDLGHRVVDSLGVKGRRRTLFRNSRSGVSLFQKKITHTERVRCERTSVFIYKLFTTLLGLAGLRCNPGFLVLQLPRSTRAPRVVTPRVRRSSQLWRSPELSLVQCQSPFGAMNTQRLKINLKGTAQYNIQIAADQCRR